MSPTALFLASLLACEGPLKTPDDWSAWDLTTCGEVAFNSPTWTGEVQDAYEPCGLRGTSGSFINVEAGVGWLNLDYEHRDNDLSWLPVMWQLQFGVETFGEDTELGGFGGFACMLDGGECTDTTWPTEVTVFVHSYDEDDTGDPYYDIEWDVVFGDPSDSAQPWVTSVGRDWVYWTFHDYWVVE